MAEHVSRKKPLTRTGRIVSGTIGVIGELLITAAVVLALFAVWQLYWTSFQVSGQVREAVTSFSEEHKPASTNLGEVRTDAPPTLNTNPAENEIYGLLHVPKWDWMRIPLAEGIGSTVLDQGYAGHYPDTVQAGGIGNFSVAGHRRTYGNNFRWIDRLVAGDPVVVDLQDHYLVYEVDRYEIVSAADPDNVRVIAPVIGDLSFSQIPTERWMTMTTCHPEYGNTERYIVHLKFKSWTPKNTGVPAELVDEPAQ